jgi:hypothetical protein
MVLSDELCESETSYVQTAALRLNSVLDKNSGGNRAMKFTSHFLTDDGQVPNHLSLPVLVYRQAVLRSSADPASMAEGTFTRNGWSGLWRNWMGRMVLICPSQQAMY